MEFKSIHYTKYTRHIEFIKQKQNVSAEELASSCEQGLV